MRPAVFGCANIVDRSMSKAVDARRGRGVSYLRVTWGLQVIHIQAGRSTRAIGNTVRVKLPCRCDPLGDDKKVGDLKLT